MDSAFVDLIPVKYLPQIVGVLITVVCGGAGVVAKRVWSTLNQDRNQIKSSLQSLNQELATQRTNCLATLQHNTGHMLEEQRKTNDALLKIATVLEERK